MPNIFIKVPHGIFSVDQRKALAKKMDAVVAENEQMPDDAKQRFVNWVVIDEVAQSMFTCGGVDATSLALPCIAMVYLPAGVLNAASRASYVAAMHAAFAAVLPPEEKRALATSVILQEIADGQWGANGNVWRLPDFAKAAGYAHLQSMI
jgi:phenylpyruvate tautomerase PptA (4-oxalocrotonate tautomerase family)